MALFNELRGLEARGRRGVREEERRVGKMCPWLNWGRTKGKEGGFKRKPVQKNKKILKILKIGQGLE